MSDIFEQFLQENGLVLSVEYHSRGISSPFPGDSGREWKHNAYQCLLSQGAAGIAPYRFKWYAGVGVDPSSVTAGQVLENLQSDCQTIQQVERSGGLAAEFGMEPEDAAALWAKLINQEDGIAAAMGLDVYRKFLELDPSEVSNGENQ